MSPIHERDTIPGLPERRTKELEEPWHLEYCKWLVAHPRTRKRQQEAKASELAGTDIPWIELQRIRSQKNFRTQYGFHKKLMENRLEKHKQNFEDQNIPQALLLHKWGMEEAQLKGDHRAVAALVDPAIKALYREQPGEGKAAPLIVLQLGGYARANLDTPMEEIEFEEIVQEPRQLESGE